MEEIHVPHAAKQYAPYALGAVVVGGVVLLALRNRGSGSAAPVSAVDAGAAAATLPPPDYAAGGGGGGGSTSGGGGYVSNALDPVSQAALDLDTARGISQLQTQQARDAEAIREQAGGFDFGLNDKAARRDFQFQTDAAAQNEQISATDDTRASTISETAKQMDFNRSQIGANNDLQRTAATTQITNVTTLQQAATDASANATKLRGEIPAYKSAKRLGFGGVKTVTNKADIQAAKDRADAAAKTAEQAQAAAQAAARLLTGASTFANASTYVQGRTPT